MRKIEFYGMQKSIQIMGPPIGQELSDLQYNMRDLESEVKLPYVIESKVLMSPGVWNNYYYSPEEIKNAYDRTDWEDKEVRSLYTDHEDLRAREWVGEVKNVRVEGDSIVGDLFIVDKPTAIKLAYGAKMGISPKVTGQDDNGSMVNFRFDNNSVVINPAVKTAYINNMQIQEHDDSSETVTNVEAYEDVKKPYGDVSYADPGYRGDEARYPIDTEKHVRAAWSYINQPENREPYTKDQLDKIEGRITSAAKEHGIDISEEAKKNAADNEEYDKEEVSMTEKNETQNEIVSQELQDYMSFVKDYMAKNPEKTIKNAAEAWEKKKESESIEMSDVMSTLKELKEEINSLKTASKENNEEEPEQNVQDETSTENAGKSAMVKDHVAKIADILGVSADKIMDAMGSFMKSAEKSRENNEEHEEGSGEEEQTQQGTEEGTNEGRTEGGEEGNVDNKDDQINELQKKVQELQQKLDEPGERATMKTEEMSQQNSGDIDEQILAHLQNM